MNPITRRRHYMKLIYLVLYFLSIFLINFIFMLNNFFNIIFLGKITLYFDFLLTILGIVKAYQILIRL